MNKKALIDALKSSRQEFNEVLESLPEEALVESSLTGNWSVKDVLLHLTMWEAELIQLIWQAQQGRKPSTAHFQDVEVDELNRRWQTENLSRSLEAVMNDFKGVRSQTVRRVEALSDEDLTNPKRFPWQKGNPLWKWIAGDSFEHEAEHLEQIREWKAEKGY
jgi:hypothetical protein